MDIMDIFLDAVLDSVKLIPFLFVVYVLIAYLENHSDNKLYHKMVNAKWGGPVIGSLIGCVPQCGFSVIGANLYSKRLISLGTLIAIFVSTSDEAIPILLSHPSMFKMVFLVLGLKVIFAIFVGLLLDGIARMIGKKQRENITASEIESVVCEEDASCGCGGHHHEETTVNIWLYALKHTFKILAFIFAVNLILGGLIEGFGEKHIEALLLTNSVFQPALAALIGLIPNCAASIVLTEMFVSGALSLGSLIAGLCTGAGVGLIVLFRANKKMIDNLKIVGILYIVGTLFGVLLQLIG